MKKLNEILRERNREFPTEMGDEVSNLNLEQIKNDDLEDLYKLKRAK